MNQESRKTGKVLRNSEITQHIIAAAIRVHRALGPGFLESIYEEALAVEFALGGIQFIRQHPVPLFYRDHQIGEHRLDFLVEGKIVVELKAVRELEDIHFAIGPQLFESDQSTRRTAFQLCDRSFDHQAFLPRTRQRKFTR
jgi:GxxExxY protein